MRVYHKLRVSKLILRDAFEFMIEFESGKTSEY